MPANTQFHLLSFEGPDAYARAGGIASRITGLAHALAEAGGETHLWFIGDPEATGHEDHGLLQLHRWCQWISRYHPSGVYDGEDGKCRDYASSLPPHLLEHHLLPALAAGRRAVVLAEEWHTVDAVLHLDWLLRRAGVRECVSILWNANNVFGFERIDWGRLQAAATIVTVSRYMKHRLWTFGVDAIVIPNGLGPESFVEPEKEAVAELRRRSHGRILLTKVARWDPDKRWLLAVEIVAALKRHGERPLFIARGGLEAHEGEVVARARAAGLSVIERGSSSEGGARGLLAALHDSRDADVVILRSHLDPATRGVLFRGADAVLANSAHEPFGLVGLETMAVGGLACTGASGEDYAVDGENALVLSRNDPEEFRALFTRLRDSKRDKALRRSGVLTARTYAWPRVVERALLPRI